jgi:vitamin B12 transporter
MNFNKQKSMLCFRRWSRKGYAVFASLNKVVKIGVVTFGCSLVQQEYQPVFAQADSTRTSTNVNLNEVEISESQPKLWSELARSVSVMERSEIAASPARSIDDILEQVAGIDVRQRGSDGVQADLSIRGGSFDQVMILLNGVNLTDPQTGHYSLDLPVDLQQIQRIEILQGSGARIWGPNAFSGAINIITTPGGSSPKKEAHLDLGNGSYGYQTGTASGNLQKGPWQLGGSVSYKRSEGYTDNTDFDLFNSHVQAAYRNKSAGYFQLQLGYQQKDFGANSFYTFLYPKQFESTKTLFSALNWEKSIGKINLQAQVYQRQHHDRFELFRNKVNAPSWYADHNYHQTDVTGGNLKTFFLTQYGKTAIGTEIRNEHIFSNVLGEAISKTQKDNLDKNALFTKEKNRTNYRVFIDQTVYLGALNLSAGLSGNHNSDYGSYFSGGMDAGYEISSTLKSYFNLNQSFRLPTFMDLYYKSATQISNPNLKPEKSTTYEIGLKYLNQGFKSNISAYYREGKNVIDWVQMADSTKWESKNLTKVNALGGEATVEYNFENGFFKKIRLSYDYLYLDKKASVYDSKYALDYLKHKINLHIENSLYKSKKNGALNAALNLNWQDRAGDYKDFKTELKTFYKPLFITDIRLQWAKDNLVLYTDVNNLFDAKYADIGGLIQAGRTFHAGIKVNF